VAEKKAFALRLDPALYDAIARLAAADLRSVNAEIEFLLREAVKARSGRSGEKATPEKGDHGSE